MTRAIDRQLASPSVWVHDTNPGGNQERFLHDRYLWPTDTDFREFAFNSGVAELAAQAMGSGQFRLLLVKARYQARLPENFRREKSAYCAEFLE